MRAAPPLAFALSLALPGAQAQDTLVLDTPRYEVRIDVQCDEGSVSCDRVHYRGLSRQSGKALSLRGSTAHTTCADGVTPCRFLGYEFTNGATRYFVSDEGELVVSRGERVLVQEVGTWREPATTSPP